MRRSLAALALVSLIAAGCAGSETRARGSAEVLRLGIFPNLTHAPAYVGLGSGIFEETLAPTEVRTTVFNSGSDAGSAILSGSIDAAYIGPVPTATLYLQSGKVAVVSGAVSGGAAFVVREGSGIDGPEDLHGRKIAVPGVCNTQDVALRTWLHDNGLEARDEGGDVSVAAVDNPDLLQLFRAGGLDGAWEPEPYPSLLVAEGLATPFVDEASLWPGGEFTTTQLLVNTVYMDAHPEVIRRLVEANVESIRFIAASPEEAKRIAASELSKAGAPATTPEVFDAAWDGLSFTWDPVISSQQQVARDSHELGCLEEDPADIGGIYRLDDLNSVLRQMKEEPVEVHQ